MPSKSRASSSSRTRRAAKLVSTGLPVFPLYYANDDDGQRRLGSDSRLTFTAPADGAYLVARARLRGATAAIGLPIV